MNRRPRQPVTGKRNLESLGAREVQTITVDPVVLAIAQSIISGEDGDMRRLRIVSAREVQVVNHPPGRTP